MSSEGKCNKDVSVETDTLSDGETLRATSICLLSLLCLLHVHSTALAADTVAFWLCRCPERVCNDLQPSSRSLCSAVLLVFYYISHLVWQSWSAGPRWIRSKGTFHASSIARAQSVSSWIGTTGRVCWYILLIAHSALNATRTASITCIASPHRLGVSDAAGLLVGPDAAW